MRVNTHRATKDYKFKKWEDRSPPADTLHFLSVLLLTRLLTKKKIKYEATAKKKYNKQKRKFKKKEKKDTHCDTWETEEIPFHIERQLVYNDQVGSKPWFADCCTCIVMDIFLLGWILRWKLNANSKVVIYKLKKLIKY